MSYSRTLQALFRAYEFEGNPMPADLNDVYEWAARTGRYSPPPELVRRKFVEDMRRALREDYFTDDEGNRIRAKHNHTVLRNGAQYHLWEDARTASHEHMTGSFAARRNGVVGDLKQLKTDVDWYAKYRSDRPRIPLVLDFTQDIAEIEAAQAKTKELASRRKASRVQRANSESAA